MEKIRVTLDKEAVEVIKEMIDNLDNNITAALVEYNASGHRTTAMYNALGYYANESGLDEETISLMNCFDDAWEEVDSDDVKGQEKILDYYTSEIIKVLKHNGEYKNALKNSKYQPK